MSELLTTLSDVGTPALLAGTAMVLVLVNVMLRVDFKRDGVDNTFGALTSSFSMLSNKDSVLSRDGVKDSVEGYERLFTGARKDVGQVSTEESISKRKEEYKTMVNSYYDLVTDFYEWGWGQSFHFGPRVKGETFDESLKRAEHYLALRAGLNHKHKVIDVGCGVGGPMRNIQQFCGADITGVTLNEYQVRVGNQYCEQKGIADKCRIVQGDFQKLPEYFEKHQFDHAYAVEATCHSPDRVQCFSGLNKCMKMGGYFVGYEWIVLPERGYDANNPDHVRIKEGIETGDGLPTLATAAEVVKALEDSGYEVLESFDANKDAKSEYAIPWYQTLKGSFTLSGFRMTYFGRCCTHILVNVLETLRIAPKGTVRVSALLNAVALDLVEGGEKELFTPSFFFLARKIKEM